MIQMLHCYLQHGPTAADLQFCLPAPLEVERCQTARHPPTDGSFLLHVLRYPGPLHRIALERVNVAPDVVDDSCTR
jgi:hypothetical protein